MMSLVSFTGTLVYRLEMSSEAREYCGRIGVLSSFLMSSLVLLMVYLICEQLGKFVRGSSSPVYYWADRMFRFVQFDETFDRKYGWV